MLVNPFTESLGLGQPFLIVPVEFTLLYVLCQLDVIGLSQDCQQLVVYLPHSLVWVVDQLQDLHQHLPL